MRLPRTFYFSGGFIRFNMDNGVAKYSIYNQTLDEAKPILQEVGKYTGQDLNALAKEYVLEPQFKRMLK